MVTGCKTSAITARARRDVYKRQVVLSLATDGCPIFLTDGTYYQAQGDLAACFG